MSDPTENYSYALDDIARANREQQRDKGPPRTFDLARAQQAFRFLGRWLAIIITAIATAIISDQLAYIIEPHGYSGFHDGVRAVGAIAGFWFAYTGRLAQLFRKI